MLVFFFVFVSRICSSQVLADTLLVHDSMLIEHTIDSQALMQSILLAEHHSLLDTAVKLSASDVQQMRLTQSNTLVFFLLLALLVAITIVRFAFSKTLEDIYQSLMNVNIAQQIFRTQSHDVSFSSLFLHINFIITLSLFTHFAFLFFYRDTYIESALAIVQLNFLFTIFYSTKIVVTRVIGVVFESHNECEEYLFYFKLTTKTIGLTLLPALFLFLFVQQELFVVVLVLCFVSLVTLVFMLLWRALSTGVKLMYKSTYHFLIYVCAVEVTPILLLVKFLTKPIF